MKNNNGSGEQILCSRGEVVEAFAHGDHLSKNERRMAMWNFRNGFRMSLKKACLIALKYGLGWINETKVNLHKLTLAWLKVGEKMWQKIVKALRVFNFPPSFSLPKLCALLHRFLSHHKLECKWAW